MYRYKNGGLPLAAVGAHECPRDRIKVSVSVEHVKHKHTQADLKNEHEEHEATWVMHNIPSSKKEKIKDKEEGKAG